MFLNGIVRQGDTFIFEFLSSSNKTPYISFFEVRENLGGQKELYALHNCHAIRNNLPCWHIALAHQVLEDILNVQLSFYACIDNDLSKKKVFAGGIDCTMQAIGVSGKFKILRPDEEKELSGNRQEECLAPEMVEAMHPDDRWLLGLKLPLKLLERVIEFRERQRVLLSKSPEMLIRIPNLGGEEPEKTIWASFLEEEALLSVKRVEYFPSSEEEIAEALSPLLFRNWNPVMFTGAASTAKTTKAYFVGRILMLPVTILSGNVNTSDETLLGYRDLDSSNAIDMSQLAKLLLSQEKQDALSFLALSLSNSQIRTVHVPGVLLEPIQKGGLLIFNEINQALPDVLSILNDVLDWQKRTYVQGIGEVHVAENFRLIATRNIGYVGTSELNWALNDRFHDIKMNYPSESVVSKVIKYNVPDASDEYVKKLCNIYGKLTERVKSGEMDPEVISLRSLLRAAENSLIFDKSNKRVLVNCLTSGINDVNAIEIISDIIEAIFS